MVDLLQYLIGGLVAGSIYGLIGIAYTAVYNVTRIVNFAQGDFAMIGALTAIAAYQSGVALPVAVVVAVAAVAVLGFAVERLAIRPARAEEVRGIVITLGIGTCLQGLAVALWGTDARSLPAFSGERPWSLAGATIPPQALWIVGASAMLVAGLQLFFRATFVGKAFRACAVNPYAARLMGIDVEAMHTIAFLLSGALGAVAGILVAPVVFAQFDTGITLGIKGFVACVIGGLGKATGAAVGGLLLGVLEALATGVLSSGYKNAIAFVLLVLFLFFRPQGMLGELERAER